MENTIAHVALRKRATPYAYDVIVTSEERRAKLFDGKAYRDAVGCYWQAVEMLRFLKASGEVNLRLTENRNPFGGFTTKVEAGSLVVHHKPNGQCREWVTRGWIGHPIEEKVISTIPNTLGTPRDPDKDLPYA